jgi:REP element-mobilizing transposase RayT
MIYRGFPSKLHHDVPPWVDPNSLFHIRIRLDRDKEQTPLTDALLATTLLKSAEFYDSKFRWHIALFLLMPDHVHAMLAFQRDGSMSRVIGDWKHFHARKNRIEWQEGFFDHRLRDDERGEQLQAKVIHPAKSCRSGPLRERRRMAMGHRQIKSVAWLGITPRWIGRSAGDAKRSGCGGFRRHL